MITLKTQKFRKDYFSVNVFVGKKWIGSRSGTPEEIERKIKVFCDIANENGTNVEIVGDNEVLKKLGLLRPKEIKEK